MTITQSQTPDAGIVQRTVGRYLITTGAAAITISCGYKPRYVRVVNVTDRIMMEWFEGMTAATGVKTIADGTRTLAATNGITVSEGGFIIGFDTDLVANNKQISWIAFG